MKSSLRKLRELAAHHRPDSKEKRRDLHPRAKLDELAQASQDMQDMRSCYDSLLSAAAATANCAYEFSESLRELGTCLLEKSTLNDDEEGGRVLLMLGKVQLELQKLVDGYRSHITHTISTPSESLLNELRTVEEMKRQCDEKREVYEYMLEDQREKGRPKNSKESFSPQQLQDAREDYDQEATLFVFRLKSLKQGQSRSLLTQAVRHHSAQLSFFRRGIKSLEAVEPHVKLVAEKQRIDYQFSGLEDYDTDADDNDDSVNDGYVANDDGELSLDYGQNEQVHDIVLTSRNSMELDQADHTLTTVSTMEIAQENLDKSQPDLLSFRRPRPGSQSAPIFPDKKFDPAERIKDLRASSTMKLHAHVLPTPIESSTISFPGNPVSSTQMDGMDGWPRQLWHSSPLEPNKHVRNARTNILSNAAQSQSVLKESNSNSDAIKMPPPLAEDLSVPSSKERWDYSSSQYNPHNSDLRKIKRQAYSGPLPSKGFPTKPIYSTPSSQQHQVIAPMPTRVAPPLTLTSPKVSPSASPPIPSPKINELHELPRPPGSSANLTRPSSLVGHSAPLVSRGQELSTTGRIPFTTSQMASPLPTPPRAMARSFSIPSSSQRTVNVAKLMGTSQLQGVAEEISLPLLTPVSLANSRPESTASEPVLQPVKAKGL